MKKLEKLPKDALVVACDSRRALFLRNTGTTMNPELVTEHHMDAPPNPANRDQQSDRPGRLPDQKVGGGKGPVSAMEQSDWQARNEEEFATKVAADNRSTRHAPRATYVYLVPSTMCRLLLLCFIGRVVCYLTCVADVSCVMYNWEL